MKLYHLDKEHSVLFESKLSNNGFRHIAVLFKYGSEASRASISYINRTWETYQYQSVLSKLLYFAFSSAAAARYLKKADKCGLWNYGKGTL